MPNLRELSRLADVDPRTLIAFFSHEPMKPRVRARIQRALDALNAAPDRRDTPPLPAA